MNEFRGHTIQGAIRLALESRPRMSEFIMTSISPATAMTGRPAKHILYVDGKSHWKAGYPARPRVSFAFVTDVMAIYSMLNFTEKMGTLINLAAMNCGSSAFTWKEEKA